MPCTPTNAKPELRLYPNHFPVVTDAMRAARQIAANRIEASAGFDRTPSPTEVWLAKRPRAKRAGSFKQNARRAS